MTQYSPVSIRHEDGGGAARRLIRGAAVVIPLLAASCNPAGFSTGPLQPQSVSGPCTVKSFFLVRLTNTATEMATDSTPTACTFTMIDPDLQELQHVAWVTNPPGHGKVAAGLTDSDRSVIIAYTPVPGYVGTDKFTVTTEPSDRTVTVSVTVRPAAAAAQ